MNPTYDFDLSVQEKFLSLMIMDNTWGHNTGMEVLRPEYFDSIILKNICTWVHKYYRRYTDAITKSVLLNEAREFINRSRMDEDDYFKYTEVIEEICNISETDDREYLKEQAIKFARKAAYFNALMNAKDIFDKSDNYDDAINMFKDALNIGSTDSMGLDFEEDKVNFLDLIGETYSKDAMVSTGIPGWDEALGGGFVKDNIHLIGGAPGFGKSKTMACLARNALQAHKKVIFITLELSEAETMANIMNSVTGLSLHDMLLPENRAQFDEKVAQFSAMCAPHLKVKFYKPATVTTDTIQNYIHKVIHLTEKQNGEVFKPDIIFIDYMDKLLPTAKLRGNNYDDIGNVGDDLKNLAITFSCPVISGSQLGRISWDLKGDEVISMSSIAESAKKVHLAHSLTTINNNPAEKEMGKARLYMAKSRSGIPGRVIWCDYNLRTVNITEVPYAEHWDPNEVYKAAPKVIGANSK